MVDVSIWVFLGGRMYLFSWRRGERYISIPERRRRFGGRELVVLFGQQWEGDDQVCQGPRRGIGTCTYVHIRTYLCNLYFSGCGEWRRL